MATNSSISIEIPIDFPEPLQEMGSLINSFLLIIKAVLEVCHSLSRLIIDVSSFGLSKFGIESSPAMAGFLDLLIILAVGYVTLGYVKDLTKWAIGIFFALILLSIGYHAFF